MMVGVVVSICGLLWVTLLSARLAAFPEASSIVTPGGRLTAVAIRSGVFCPAATV